MTSKVYEWLRAADLKPDDGMVTSRTKSVQDLENKIRESESSGLLLGLANAAVGGCERPGDHQSTAFTTLLDCIRDSLQHSRRRWPKTGCTFGWSVASASANSSPPVTIQITTSCSPRACLHPDLDSSRKRPGATSTMSSMNWPGCAGEPAKAGGRGAGQAGTQLEGLCRPPEFHGRSHELRKAALAGPKDAVPGA